MRNGHCTPATGSTSPWNSAAALLYPSPTRSANETRQAKLLEFCGFRRLFRLRHHVVDGRPDLGVAQRWVPALGRHRSRAPLYAVDGAGVERVATLGDVLGPLALVTQLRRAGYAGTVAGDAGGLVDLLPVAAGWRSGHRVFYMLPLRFRRGDVDLGDGVDPLVHTRTGAQEHAAIQSDPIGDVLVMAHKKENKQHQHYADPENDRNIHHVALFSHC